MGEKQHQIAWFFFVRDIDLGKVGGYVYMLKSHFHMLSSLVPGEKEFLPSNLHTGEPEKASLAWERSE